MARTKTNTRNDTKTLTTSWRNRHLEKLYFCVFRKSLYKKEKMHYWCIRNAIPDHILIYCLFAIEMADCLKSPIHQTVFSLWSKCDRKQMLVLRKWRLILKNINRTIVCFYSWQMACAIALSSYSSLRLANLIIH